MADDRTLSKKDLKDIPDKELYKAFSSGNEPNKNIKIVKKLEKGYNITDVGHLQRKSK